MLRENITAAMRDAIAEPIRSSDKFAAMQKTMGQRLRERREELDLTQGELAALSGVRQETISNIETGRNKGSRYIAQLARALKLDAHFLATGKPYVLAIADRTASGNVSPGPDLRGTVPLISWVQAGAWRTTVDNLELSEGERLPVTVQVKRHTYALRVRGDSMVAPHGDSFPEGSIIVVEPELEPQTGDYVVVQQAGKSGEETTFKRLVRDGDRYFLEPLNPRYPVAEMGRGATICGVVREAIRRFR